MAKVETEPRHQLPISNPQKKNLKSNSQSKDKAATDMPQPTGVPNDKVSLSRGAEVSEGGGTQSSSDSTNSSSRQLPFGAEEANKTSSTTYANRPQKQVIIVNEPGDEDPLAGLPKVAIDYRSRYFRSPGVKKGQIRVSKPQETSDAS